MGKDFQRFISEQMLTDNFSQMMKEVYDNCDTAPAFLQNLSDKERTDAFFYTANISVLVAAKVLEQYHDWVQKQ